MAPHKFSFFFSLLFFCAVTTAGAEKAGVIYGEDVIIKGSGHIFLTGQDTLQVVPLVATVIGVSRGDRLRVKLANGSQSKVELLGIVSPRKGKPWGEAAITFSTTFALGHTGTLLVTERLPSGVLRGFFIIEHRSLGILLVRRGLARTLTNEKRFGARGTYARYRRAQMGAMASQKGMWGWPRPKKP